MLESLLVLPCVRSRKCSAYPGRLEDGYGIRWFAESLVRNVKSQIVGCWKPSTETLPRALHSPNPPNTDLAEAAGIRLEVHTCPSITVALSSFQDDGLVNSTVRHITERLAHHYRTGCLYVTTGFEVRQCCCRRELARDAKIGAFHNQTSPLGNVLLKEALQLIELSD